MKTIAKVLKRIESAGTLSQLGKLKKGQRFQVCDIMSSKPLWPEKIYTATKDAQATHKQYVLIETDKGRLINHKNNPVMLLD